ncbi:hypothetical protein GJ496_007482 [Pomphorhynchus laevis]|nr:hypothetical protein GJ496_005635 [Pomphorhynchus laevis]KAI0981309.1 hypothetical protein GJ496_007482 [Pomphorhynchus laevis]
MSWLPSERTRKAVKSGGDTRGSSTQPPLEVREERDPRRQAGNIEGNVEEGGDRPRRRQRQIRIDEVEESFLKMSLDDSADVGKIGQTFSVLTNFFDIETMPKFIVHEYMVYFEPECLRRRNRLAMLNSFKKSFLGSFAYDGMKLFVSRRLHSTDSSNTDDSSDKEEHTITVTHRNQHYQIVIKHVNVVAPNTLPFIQLLGILFRDKLYKLGMRSINRNLYELGKEHRVQEEGIYMFPGVKSSILPKGSNKNMLLCVDKLHKIINSSTLDEYMYSFERWDQHDKDEVKRFLVGQSVVTRYNMNSYRVDDVDFNKSIQSMFDQNGRQVSYIEYYKEFYNENLKCNDLPLLAVRSKRADGSRSSVYLVPELCHLAGVNTGLGGNLNIMRSLSKHCGPVNRMSYVKSLLKRIQDSVDSEQQESGLHWGLNIKVKPKEISARCMPVLQPLMDCGRSSKTWPQVCNSGMLKPVPLKDWIVLHSRNTDVNALINGIWETMSRLGMQPADPIIQQLDGDSVRSVNETLQRLQNQNQLNAKQIVMVVQQDRTLDKNYKEMKKVFSQRFGLITQFIKGRNCRGKPAVHQKIALQIGCKIGGEAWALHIPFKKPTMIFGIDCYHARGSSSVAACVATLNRFCTKFYSRCCIQQEGQEILSAIKGFVLEAFQQFGNVNNGRLPDQLIIYRDGVGDGQLGYIREHELSQISEVAKSLNSKCTITFIVVKKQGSARFFLRQGGGPDSIANPPAGTIVDHTVTNSNWRDFYLIPQKVTQGTATPSHFNVILDECQFSMDFIQDMTFKLCHMYFNWTGPIRVPAMCQYAHKLAFLVGTCMSGEPSAEQMYNKLYYL